MKKRTVTKIELTSLDTEGVTKVAILAKVVGGRVMPDKSVRMRLVCGHEFTAKTEDDRAIGVLHVCEECTSEREKES